MKYQWNWTDFFRQDIQPPFVIKPAITEKCPDLLKLPFVQGLAVIVTSVPAFAHSQWIAFQDLLAEHAPQHKHIDYWLMVGQLIRDDLEEVKCLLDYDIEHATDLTQRILTQRTGAEQFALMTCLHHYAQTSVQARMMFQYLLQNCNPHVQQMRDTLNFYRNLTERQKDVAVLAAHGLTNQEIAEALYIEPRVVAEHLTGIFGKFEMMIQFSPDKHGTRYRLIHWLTTLFAENPHLLLDRTF